MIFLSRKAGIAILLIIPMLGMLDGIRFNSRYITTYDYKRDFTPNQLTDYFKSLPGKFRVVNFSRYSQNLLPFHGIEVVTGYHGNQLRWYDDLLGGPSLQNRQNPRFLNLVGARFILIPAGSQIPSNYFGDDTLTLAGNFGPFQVLENRNALPRAFLVNRYTIIPDRADIYPEILTGESDLREIVYLEEEPPIDVFPADSSDGTAEIISYGVDSIIVDIRTDSNAILVVTDNYYHRWEAWVDGEKTNILRANGSFRAIPVNRGASQVLIKYDNTGNRPAWRVSLLTLLLIGIILIVYLYIYLNRERKESDNGRR
jgi:hypothetical protein